MPWGEEVNLLNCSMHLGTSWRHQKVDLSNAGPAVHCLPSIFTPSNNVLQKNLLTIFGLKRIRLSQVRGQRVSQWRCQSYRTKYKSNKCWRLQRDSRSVGKSPELCRETHSTSSVSCFVIPANLFQKHEFGGMLQHSAWGVPISYA